MVEREGQVTRLRELLAGCCSGVGAVAALSGPVAGGKTELLHVLGELAAAAGAVVLHATARCSERDVELGVMGQIFRHQQFSAAERERALRPYEPGGALAACDADLLAHRPTPARVSQVHWQLLRALSERAPVVVIVDDVHFADAASLDSLMYVGRLLRSTRVLLVVAERDAASGAGTTELSWRTSLVRQRHVTRLRVRPLSPAGTGELVGELVGPGLDARPWHRLSGGNPLLLRALAEDHHDRVAAGAPGPGLPGAVQPLPGEEYGRAVDACVRRVGEEYRDTARALAVLDASGSSAHLAGLTGRPASALAGTLAAMDGLGFLDAGRFRHPAARTAVLAGMPAAERTLLHRAAARLLHSAGEPAPVVAVHLAAARHSAEPWAYAVALEAAREALHRDDTAFAEACLDVAEAAATDEDRRATVTVLRSLVDFRTDPDTACRRLRPLVAALREGRLPGCQIVPLLGRLLWTGGSDEILLALRRLERSADLLDARQSAEYQAVRHGLSASHPALLPRPVARARTSPRALLRTPDGPAPRMSGVLNRLLRSGPGPDAVRSAELVLQTTPLDDTSFETVHQALSVLVYADRPDLAAPWAERLAREAARRDVPTWQALFAALRAEAALRQGEVRLAERCARQALGLVSVRGWGALIGSPLATLELVAAATGRAEAGGPPVATLPEQLYETRFGVQYLHARGRWRLSVNLLHGALDDLTRCGRLMREWDIDLPAFVPWRGDAVTALLRLGRTEEARRLAVEQVAMVPVSQPRARGIALHSAASVADSRRRAALLRESADLLEGAGDRLELARVLVDLSEVHTRAGQRGRARMVARQALDIAEEQGLVPLARRLAAGEAPPVRPERGGPHRAGALSGSEAQVAALAVAGLSNREIAEKLFITVSTVEQHLTHTYRKLRVKGRADLPLSLLGAVEHGPQERASARAGGHP
ncbi:LuxR C-terminal-related transcriptional regulator [Streptomyces sp. NPDC093252]|uniref:helix-turn-helix transcriptional regulator n=1 Tax=Streptomyces sp. NPDC093252 TaxID=3154980 RepID=UPI003439D3B7